MEAMQASNNQIEIQISKYINTISHRQLRWYKGVVIPAIIAQVQEQEGKELSRAMVELINKQHANDGNFKTMTIGNKEVLLFEEYHVSQMNKDEFQSFMDNLTFYWGQRGIEIPQPVTEESNRINELARKISGQ